MENNIRKLTSYLKFELVLTEDDLLDCINELTKKKQSIKFDELYVKLMKGTDSILVINNLALIMEEFPDDRYKEVLFEVFQKRTYGERGTIFFAMTAYDYGERIKELVNILLFEGISDEESMSLLDILLNMKSLNKKQIDEFLKFYLKIETTGNKEKLIVNTVIYALKKLKKQNQLI